MRYRELQEKALNYVKVGGDVEKAQVFATLALAEAVREIPDSNVADAITGLAVNVGDIVNALDRQL